MRLIDLIPKETILRSKADDDTALSGITDDSRKVAPGTAYFAIAGTKIDGHAFLPSAVERGAQVLVVEDPAMFERFAGAVLVESTRRAYALACSRFFQSPSRRFRLVGVTGTNGKTTSTFLISQLLKSLGHSTALLGTVQTEIGDRVFASDLTTPGPRELQELFAEAVEKKIPYAVMEVSSIALDQFRVWGSAFEVALFTNLTQDHLDYHGDFETYYAAKRRLFDEYSVPAAVINIDDPWGARLAKEARSKKVFTYALEKPADFKIEYVSCGPSGSEARIRTPEGEVTLKTPLIAQYNVMNCVGVLAAAYALGIPCETGATALSGAIGARGRLERIPLAKGLPHVFVDYAHTPDALLNVLKELARLKERNGRLITVFGCGGDRDRTKRPQMGRIASELSDRVIVTSDNPRTEKPEAIVDEIVAGVSGSYSKEVNRRRAIEEALREAKGSDIVLIAGKGHETYQILGTEKIHFDDREIVQEFYKSAL